MWNAARLRLPLSVRRLLPGAGALLLGLWLAYAVTLAAPDLDKTQVLALQRYGAGAAETIVAWRRLIEESRVLSNNDKLNKVNTFFNRRILFKTDWEVYKRKTTGPRHSSSWGTELATAKTSPSPNT